MRYLYMGLGGVLGVLSRYAVGGLTHRWLGLGFPYGTLAVNLSGCMAMGFLAPLGQGFLFIGPQARAFWFIGFLGAYTTFSTYMLEGQQLLEEGRPLAGLAYLFLRVAAGYLGLQLGIWAARLLE